MKTQKIEKFDSKLLDELQTVIKDALAVALEKYGLAVRVGSIKYDATQFTAKVEVETGNNAEAQFKQYAKLLNYDPDWFGKKFEIKGEMHEVVGVNPSKSKMPIQLRSETGTEYTYSVDGLRLALGDKEAVMAELRKKAEQEHQQKLRDARYDFIWSALEHKLNPAWIDQDVVEANGKKHKITGLYKKARKFFVLLDDKSMLDVASFVWLVNQDVNKHLREMPEAKPGDVWRRAA